MLRPGGHLKEIFEMQICIQSPAVDHAVKDIRDIWHGVVQLGPYFLFLSTVTETFKCVYPIHTTQKKSFQPTKDR